MKSKILFSVLCSLLLAFMFVLNISAQDKSNASGGLVPPDVNNTSPVFVERTNSSINAGRAFGYNAYGTTIPVGPFKFFLNNPSAPVSLSTDPSANYIRAGAFDGLGNWLGIRYGNNQIVRIDTTTGEITTLGTITGATAIIALAYDFTTGTMYAMDYGTVSRLGTLELSTYTFTPIGGSIVGIVNGIACSNAGQLYGVNISDDNFYLINKNTGNGSVIGPLIPSTGLGLSWDHNVDSCYWSTYVTTGELRKINHATGGSTLIGLFNMEVAALAIPVALGPMISHIPLQNTQNTTGPYVVNAGITVTGSTIASAKVFWSRNNVNLTDSVTMTNTGGTNWTGNIPGNGTDALYRYRIKAIDALGRIGFAPETGVYSFWALSTDTSHVTIVTTPIVNCSKFSWPTSVSASVSNIYGIDSVWVKWYKNNPSTGWKRFNLAHRNGNNWTGKFNSTNPEVEIGDSISYRVFARNSSAQHKVDSTAQYTFKIIYEPYIVIGTDTLSDNFPFTTYWMDGRTDYLYHNTELNLWNGAQIWDIGFNVITPDPITMHEFTIKMQNTTVTSISGFTDTGWTTVYSQDYTLPGTGWQMISLSNKFIYNGTNILVEVCYNNSSYSNYSPVYASYAPGDYWGRYNDLYTASGCGYTSWTSTTGPTGRANTKFVLNPILNIKNLDEGIPDNYALSQNYPNPFNPTTKINFAIPKQGFVSLKVYDILGRMVSQLVNEVKTAGTYSVDFNASNFASGIYFYKLEVNNFTDVKRMVFLK